MANNLSFKYKGKKNGKKIIISTYNVGTVRYMQKKQN